MPYNQARRTRNLHNVLENWRLMQAWKIGALWRTGIDAAGAAMQELRQREITGRAGLRELASAKRGRPNSAMTYYVPAWQ